MPYIIRRVTEGVELSDAQIERLLWNEDGSPTLRGQVLSDFLYEEVDWSDFFDAVAADPDLADAITTTESYVRETKNGDWMECDEDHEDAIPWPIEELDGAIVAEEVDMDDLVECFKMWVDNLPEDTLASKTSKRVAEELLYGSDEDDIDEDLIDEKAGYKRGTFRKMRKREGGAQGTASQVNRMLGAMQMKGAISRAKKSGKGYKKGDWSKEPAGYPVGTPKGLKKHKKWRKSHKGNVAKAEKAAKGAKSRAGQGKKRRSPMMGVSNRPNDRALMRPTRRRPRQNSSVDEPGANLTESFGPKLAGQILGGKPVKE
jgi:hypothetical protein